MRDLTTRLETEGITDAIAAAEYGFPGTAAMAQAWMPRILVFDAPPEALPQEPSAWREYWQGISFALPLLCSSVSVLLFGFSLWGGAMSAEDATAVGLGTVLSFLLTGGFVQAMARRGLFYATTNQFRLCLQSNRWWLRASLIAVAAALLIGLAGSAYWDWLPQRMNFIAIAFSVTLALFWLGTGILHVVGKSLAIVWSTLAGIGIVAFLHVVFRWPLIASQLAAILAASAAAFLVSRRAFRRKLDSPVRGAATMQVRDLFQLWPFFAYGILYYVLLFGDRLISWTADTYATPFGLMFRGDYESALNIGLIAFVFQVGWVHRSTAIFYREMPWRLREFSVDEVAEFRSIMLDFYWARLRRFVPFVLAATTIALLASMQMRNAASVASITACSLAGFPFLVVGLWNASLLFGLSNAAMAAKAAAWACLINVAAGYFLSRFASYPYAVVGFTVGAIIFATLSGIYTRRAFNRLDYAWFAASV